MADCEELRVSIASYLLQGGDLWRIMARDKDRAVFGWYRRCVDLILTVASSNMPSECL